MISLLVATFELLYATVQSYITMDRQLNLFYGTMDRLVNYSLHLDMHTYSYEQK